MDDERVFARAYWIFPARTYEKVLGLFQIACAFSYLVCLWTIVFDPGWALTLSQSSTLAGAFVLTLLYGKLLFRTGINNQYLGLAASFLWVVVLLLIHKPYVLESGGLFEGILLSALFFSTVIAIAIPALSESTLRKEVQKEMDRALENVLAKLSDE